MIHTESAADVVVKFKVDAITLDDIRSGELESNRIGGQEDRPAVRLLPDEVSGVARRGAALPSNAVSVAAAERVGALDVPKLRMSVHRRGSDGVRRGLTAGKGRGSEAYVDRVEGVAKLALGGVGEK